MRVELTQDQDGNDMIACSYHDDDGVLVEHRILIGTIATWRELLGIDDPVAVVEAYLYVQEHGEPPCDPETGRNAWTEPHALLRRREQARNAEAARAEADGETDRGRIISRANSSAYDAVHIPVQGDKCAMDLCREQAQRELRLPVIGSDCGPNSRTDPCEVVVPQRASWERIGPLPPQRSRAEEVAKLLQGREQELLGYTQLFLHGLSGDPEDRVTPPPTPELKAEPRLRTADELLTKYQEADK